MSMDSAHRAPLTLDMGHGQVVILTDEGEGRWKLAFRQDGRDAPAPPLDEIMVEAIDPRGQCYEFKMFRGPSPSEVYASGPTEDACRARVSVVHGAHAHRREVTIPGAPDFGTAVGANGGTLISMGHHSFVEVLPQEADRWKLSFFKKQAVTAAPAIDDVKAEAIGDETASGQINDLTVLPGNDDSSLFLAGRLRDARFLRLSVMMGEHYHTRAVPIPQN